MSSFFKYTCLATWALAIFGCAQQVNPKGGDKDTVPPRIVGSEPLNESVSYTGNGIVLEFDEYVSLKGAPKELIVSPPLKYPVEFKLKRKKVFVSWKDTLHENTTYTFQFGKGIVDVNEQNALDSSLFVFSTGNYIDSFEIQGKVLHAFDLKPQKDVWVMLYEQDIDSLPYKEIPRYSAKTDNTGSFQLKYLKPGNYKCFALMPMNSGYLFDVPEEGIAFPPKPITAQNPADTTKKPEVVMLRFFVQEDSTQYVKSYEQLSNKGLTLALNRPDKSIKLRELNGMDVSSWAEKWSADFDSVTYWFPQEVNYDSMKLEVAMGRALDTLSLRKPPVRSAGKRGKKGRTKEALALVTNGTGSLAYFSKLMFRSITPIVSTSGIRSGVMIENRDTVDYLPYVTTDFYGFSIGYPWKQDTKYRFILPDSAVTDRFGQSNDSLLLAFTATRKEDYGQLVVKCTLPAVKHPFVWQLLTKEGKVIDERGVQSGDKVSYDHLLTGTYRVRLIFDADANGKWTTGYYPDKRQPERAIYYNTMIEVRSNWLSEIEWVVK